MGSGRLSERNAAIAEMLSNGDKLKDFYRFVAQNPHINLHDACQIIVERPNASVCYAFSEWEALGRRITKGRKGIAYYDYDGYKQFVFDANDTHGEHYQRPILPMKRLLAGLDELNDTKLQGGEQSDYNKIYKGVQIYLLDREELSGDGERDKLIVEGIAFSLYSKTGFPKSAGVKLKGLPYSFSENAELIKELHITTDALIQDIEDLNENRNEVIEVIDDTEEETISDEPIVGIEQSDGANKNLVEIDECSSTNYEGYVAIAVYSWLNEYENIEDVYIGKEENLNSGTYDNSDNSLIFLSNNHNVYDLLTIDSYTESQEELVKMGAYTEDDYEEYAEIKAKVLDNLDCIQEIRFGVKKDTPDSGVTFRYPDWMNVENTVEQTEATGIIFSSSIKMFAQNYVILTDYKRTDETEETLIYIGKQENLDEETNKYDNSDNSLIYITDRPQMPFLLYGKPYAQTQQELIDDGTFTEEDYADYARLQDGILREILAKQPLKFGCKNNQEGEPFKYPNWQEVESVEQVKEDKPNHPMYPSYKRYMEAQKEKPDAIVLMRLGDFYEAFDESAKELSKELDLTLTGRVVGLPERIPMVGIPFHAMDRYLNKILEQHGVLLLEDGEEPIYMPSNEESLQQIQEMKEKRDAFIAQLESNEPTPFDDEQSETEDDWRNELAAELGDLEAEQDEETEEAEIGEDEELDETDSSSDEQDEETEQVKEPKVKDKKESTNKKPEKGIKDRKRKEKPQISLFDITEPQEKTAEEALIERQLKYGSGVEHSKFRIFDKYQENPTIKSFTNFLRDEYGWGSHGGWGGDNEMHDAKGIAMSVRGAKGEYLVQVSLKWPDVAVRIADLIDDDNYLSEQEKKKYVEYKVDQNRLRELRAEQERQKNELINKVIYSAPDDRKQRILDEYAITTKLVTFSEFLKNEYGTCEEKNEVYTATYNSMGAWIYRSGDENDYQKRIYLNWNEFADKVCSLIENDRYIEQPKETLTPEEKINAIVDGIVKEGTEKTTDGKWFVYFEDYKEDEQFVRENKHKISEQLVLRKEVAQAGMDDISIDATFHLEYCPNYDWNADDENEQEEKEGGENTDLNKVLDQSELGGAKARFKGNVAAIRLVNKLYSENRNPTEAEKKVLSQFVGWGGLSQAFDENNAQWKKEYTELKGLLSQEDYEQARGSTLNAYYTAKDVIGGIYSALNRFGVKGNNRILEPSMGTGNFFGFMPQTIASGSRLYGVELDNLTGRIAAKLYPQANVQIKGFEDTTFPNDKFDIVVGNVPFGGYGVADSDYNRYNFRVHDYFLAKSIDKVKPNGIVAIVTSKGTMDKQNPSARKYVAERAELIGAIRLPNTAFKQTAGTEAVADILFFRKREERVTDISGTEWLGTGKTEEGYEINQYFVNHPEMVLGTLAKEQGLYGGIDVTVKADGRELSEAMAEAVKNLPQDFYVNPETSPEAESTIEVDYNVKPMCYKAENGRLYMRVGDEMQEQAIPKYPKDAYQRIQGMIGLREELHHILDLQIQGCSDEVLEREQRKLNAQYDLFVRRYGELNGQTNSRLFKEDGDSALLLACEDVDKETGKISKSDVFDKRTIRPYVVPTSTDDCFEALQISKNERGRVDISYIEELTGKSYDDVLFELGDTVFRNPETTDRTDKYSGFETSEEYLSGKVVAKLETARRYAAEYPEYKSNVEALEKVQPTPLTASEISVRLGQTWVDKDYYKLFYMELVGVTWWRRGDVELFYNPHDSSWRLDQKDSVRYDTQMKQKELYGTKRAPAYRLFIDCMNLKATTIYDTVIDPDGKERRVLNQAETIAAREKQNKIREEFANWIFAKPERREDLEATYNRLFNQIRLPSYDGSYLKFPEMNPAIELRPHQKDAIHRIITNDQSTLLHHVVGSGKTYTMAASIMKMRQLGLCKKAMVAVPNHLVQQWASEWRKLYPNAKILVATKEDLEKTNRQKFVSKVALGDWDGIIIAQSSFAKIPVSMERQIKKLNEEIESVEQTIQNQWEERGMPRGAVKNLERIKKTKQAQLKKLMDDKNKDSVLTFENLGVDYLYIDEAHYYKNLFLFTKMNNVAGISNAASQRASDLKLKCEYLQELHDNDRGVVFATGTPISNSMTEMYTMQRYLQPSTLKEIGIEFFDGWAADFGETVTSMELAPSGKGYQARTRFAKFTNLPELQTLYRSFADVITSDMVQLDVPEAEKHVINLKPSDTVVELAEKIAERAEIIHSGGVKPEEDNMLKVTSDGKKLALDPRCFVPESADEEGSKLNEAAQRIYEIWASDAEKKTTQIAFCDMSTPKVRSEEYIYGLRFDAYNDLKYKLVQKGIPANEIAFIHDAKTDEQKQTLFDRVNSGKVRVLIGSTEKCGAGTNVQKRLLALHHLDTPYRPSDMEQREGRIIRQGNTNEKVDIYIYVTERTFDSYSYQILENKNRFIKQIEKGTYQGREYEDIDLTTLSYAEIKAITAANPRIKRKMEVDTEILRLRILEGQYKKNLYDLQDKIRKGYPEDIRKQELLIERVTLDLMHLQSSKPTDPEAFEISVNGKVYTDRKEGGKALTDALYASKPETVIAEYCGFKISMNPMTTLTGERDITLTANGQYIVGIGESSSGNLTRLDNFIEDFPKRKERLENKLNQLKDDLEIAKEQVEKPFEHKQQLSELLSEQAELNAELNLDKRDEVVIGDENDTGEDNYRALPTQKYEREVKIIDEEDKVAAMKIEVLPDYSISQDEMHEYGYKWDGMLPISKSNAYMFWLMGLTVCKLGKDDDHIEVDDYADFDNDGKTMYGIEKPVWKKYIDSEKSAPYLFARLHVTSAISNMISDEMNYIDDKFIGKFKEDNFRERANLEDFLPYKKSPNKNDIKTGMYFALKDLSERLWCDELKMYGWTKDDIAKSIAAHITDTDLRKYAEQQARRNFDVSTELIRILNRFTDEEIDEMNLPAFDDELTVVAKEPSVYLNDTEKTYLPGLLALRNEVTGEYYVINDTSARNKEGNELEMDDTTDVETVLAYNGLYDGNPLRTFGSEKSAKAYYLEKLNAIRSVKVNSTDYKAAVVSSVQLEFSNLKNEMLNSTPEEVFYNNFKIHCYNEFGSVIEDEDNLTDNDYKALYEDRGNILERIFNEYTLDEKHKAESLEDNISFIQEYCRNYHSEIYKKGEIDTSKETTEKEELQTNSIDYEKKVVESVNKEVYAYEDGMKNFEQDEVEANSERLQCYKTFAEYLCESELVSENIFKSLYVDRGHILADLYEEYHGAADKELYSYGQVSKFVEDYCKRTHNEVFNPTVYYGKDTENRAYYHFLNPITKDSLTQLKADADMHTIAAPDSELSQVELELYHIFYLKIGRDISEDALEETNAMSSMMNAMDNYYRIYPLYLQTARYAGEHYEMIAYRNSHKSNEECKRAIDEAVSNNFDGMHLNAGFEDKLIEKYGMERVAFIVATTINEHDYDGRYSRTNKEWAKTIPMSESKDESIHCCLNVHPAVLDAFTDRIRKKYLAAYEKPAVFYANKYDMNGIDEELYLAVYLDNESGEIETLFGDNIRTEKELDELVYKVNHDNHVRRKYTLVKKPYEELLAMSQAIKKEEKEELAQDKYLHFTANGDKVLSIIKDRDDRNIAIVQREKMGDFVVAAGYDTTDGTWRAAKYDLPTLEAAEKYRAEKYGFEKMSDTADRKWLTCKVSPEALIKKYQFNSRFRMPSGSGYEGYAYSIFNDRIKEGTITTDLKSDTRERALVLSIPTDKKVEIRSGEKTIEIEPHDFISLVNETTSDKYEREQRYTVGFPPEAFIKEYDTSMLLAMPNDTKYKGYVYYLPKSVISEDKNSDNGTLIANIGESFRLTLRKGEEKIEITAKEYAELVGDKKADKYKREPTEMDEYREQQGEDDKKWNTVVVSESAVIANYENSTLFKMPKGDYAGYVYYIPSGMVRKDEKGLSLRVPEDFVAHLKNDDEKKDLTAQEFIAAIEGKTDEDYESIYRKPSEEAVKQFEKVEAQLRRNVPKEMISKPNWVVVRTRENAETGRLDKFLINPNTGKFAESDNPETWTDFDTACKYAKENGGVCLAYALEWDRDIACIDLDGCMAENGDFSEISQQAFNAANGSYTEKSVSGKGLHIFGKTKGADLRSFSKDKTMEYYQGGHFIAMTGDYYGSSELKSFDTPEMQRVLLSKLEKRTEWKNTGKGVEGLSSMDDREMLDRAFNAKNGDNVKRLYNGEDIRGNHSNSDMSLMNYLAFWSNHDIDQMLRVFSSSGLYRPEKPQSYYEHTAIKAVKGTPCYTPPKASNNKPSGNGNGSGKDGK